MYQNLSTEPIPTSATPPPNARFYTLLGRLLLPSSWQRQQDAGSDQYAHKSLYDYICYVPQVFYHFLSLSLLGQNIFLPILFSNTLS
jgi:hypothetical protein